MFQAQKMNKILIHFLCSHNPDTKAQSGEYKKRKNHRPSSHVKIDTKIINKRMSKLNPAVY